jgi:hypothetical protein
MNPLRPLTDAQLATAGRLLVASAVCWFLFALLGVYLYGCP